MTETLYTMVDIAKALGKSKQEIDRRYKAGKIEAPMYKTGRLNGWTKEQVERIVKLSK
jgi:predicted DNA-binding transcriptional regulator AlpA